MDAAAALDLIFKVGTPLALIVLAALNSRYVTRKEFEATRTMIDEVRTNNRLMKQELENKAYIDTKLNDHESRLRAVEIRVGAIRAPIPDPKSEI